MRGEGGGRGWRGAEGRFVRGACLYSEVALPVPLRLRKLRVVLEPVVAVFAVLAIDPRHVGARVIDDLPTLRGMAEVDLAVEAGIELDQRQLRNPVGGLGGIRFLRL